jgi:hypothetical protein
MSLFHANQSYIFRLDSANRLSGTSGSFEYLIPTLPRIEYTNMCILSCSIPRSFYDIKAPFNTFRLYENTDEVIITLPEGQYNVDNFITTVEDILNANSPNSWNYTITYALPSEIQTGKLTFNVSGNSGGFVRFQFGDNTRVISDINGLYLQFGFPPNYTTDAFSSSISSVNSILISPIQQIYLTSSSSTDKAEKGVLLGILNVGDVSQGDYIPFINQGSVEPFSRPFSLLNGNVISFSILDKFDRVIDLEGLDWTAQVLLYQKNPTDAALLEELVIARRERDENENLTIHSGFNSTFQPHHQVSRTTPSFIRT